MSKYNITRSCGHEEWVSIGGPTKDRDWKAQSEARRVCRECYEKELKAKREAEIIARAEAAELAAEEAKAGNLPTMNGSEKQVAWAEQIRKEHHDALVSAAAAAITPDVKTVFDEEIAIYLSESSAHAWIERRHAMPDARWLGKQVQARALTDRRVADIMTAAIVARKLMNAIK